MNVFKRFLSMLLVLCMLVSVIPMTTLAAETDSTDPTVAETTQETTVTTEETTEATEETTEVTEETTEATEETTEATEETTEATEDPYDIALLDLEETYDLTYASDYRILHLDCGRKYFTKDWIIALINEMAAAGYTHLELAFGNDGLRFLLDEMSVGAYSDDAVTAAIKAGNEAYYDAGDVNELTQSEMDSIIAHANSKGIEIIPLLNTPGHMDAIITAMQQLGFSSPQYGSSVRTVDVADTAAVTFAQALVFKYMDYFAAKGCNEFNIGADEYANDTGNPQFSALISGGYYDEYITYLNTLAKYACEKGMIPMAFNDGIYYDQNTSNGTINENIMVCYWSSGWSGYDVASASYLANRGFKMINTHGDYYFVLKSSGITNPSDSALNFDESTFMGSTVSNPTGSMFCIWCDVPGVATEQEVAAAARITLRKMAAAMQGTTTYSEDVVVGGFNEDGSVNVEDTRTWVTASATDDSGIAVSGYDLTSVTATEVTDVSINGAKNVKAWDITPSVDGVAYTEKGTVKLPVPEGWNTALLTGFYVENGAAVLVVGEYADGYYTFDMPHFSVAGVAELSYDHLIELTIGGSDTVIIEGADLTGNTYTPDPSGIASVTAAVHNVTGSSELVQVTSLNDLVSGGKYVLVNKRSNHVLGVTTGYTNTWGTTCLVQSNETASTSSPYWTITVNGSNYYFQNSAGSYMTISSNSSNLTTTQTALTMYAYGDGSFGIAQNGYYLNDMGGAGQYAGGYNVQSDGGAPWYMYQIVETQASNGTEVTFTGTAVGETYVTIDEEVYKIVVSYNEKELNVVVNGSKSETQSAAITGEPSYSVEGIVTATISGDTVTFTAGNTTGTTVVTVGNTKYTVNVIEVDLDTVDPLKLEYWITNGEVTDPATNLKYIEISAAQSGIYSTEGVAVTELVPDSLQREGRDVEYWQTKLLDVTASNDSTSGTQEQTLFTGDDETMNDVSFTRVRYWNGTWQVLVGTTWTDVNRTEVTVKTYSNNAETGTAIRETHQLVVYYMEIIDIANTNGETELHVNAADWGFKSGDDWGYGTSEFGAYTISFQIVYEDNTTNPANDALLSKTLVYGEWAERGIGTIIFNGEGDYQIYKVTAETGDAAYTNNWNGFTIKNLTWDDNEETVWAGNPTDSVTIGNNARKPSYDGIYSNLVWHNSDNGDNPANDAILIRVYVRAAATEDTLNVHYLDATANDLEFYNYSIGVNEGTVFDTGFAMGTDKNTLVNNTVVNHNGVTQAVSADLATMPQIKAYYRYCNYTLTEVVRSDDGKDVYLYYEFTPVVSFVADFGLPLKITPTDLNQAGYETTASEIKEVKVIGTYDTEAGSTAHAEYGTLSVDGTTVTYTPTEILQGVDFFTVYVITQLDNEDTTENDEAGIAYRVYVFPATTVFYEESFLTTDTNWTTVGTALNDYQPTVKLGSAGSNNYGYDAVYADDGAVASNGTYITSSNGGLATFTFTGTGFELYANSNASSGYVTVYSQGGLSKLYMINTVLNAGTTDATNQQSGGTYYSLPVISETALPYGTYTVQIKQTNGDAPIYIDGVRIINTLSDSTVFTADEEDNPVFYELRDYVLNAIGVEDLTKSDYVDSNDRVGMVDAVSDLAGQVYTALGAGEKAIVINTDGTTFTTAQAQDLLDNGPKNELYLYPGQTLVFSVSTDRVMQLGLKAPTGSAEFTLKVDGETLTPDSLSTTVDMFYKIAEKGGTTHAVSITVSKGVLSVTDLKICDDPNFAFNALTQEDIETALLGVYGLLDEDVSDEEVIVPSEPESEPSKPGKPDKDEKPGKSEKPGKGEKPGRNEKPGKMEQTEKTATLNVVFVNLFGKRVGTATITETWTSNGNYRISVSEIAAEAPEGLTALRMNAVTLKAGETTTIVVPVI